MLLELPLRLSIVCLLALLAAGCDKEKPAAGQGGEPAVNSVESGIVIDRAQAGSEAPAATFRDPDGSDVTLAAFEGKPLLLNLWATWCAPCVAEMPTLDRLAAGRSDLQVLAVSQDMPGSEAKVAAFFEERKLANLEAYMDPEIALMSALGAPNLPTTILYDAKGREVWRVTGGLDWAGEEAKALLSEL